MTRKLASGAINCKVERRMICKAPKASVRLLLGTQMLLYGVFSVFTGYEALVFGSWELARYEHLWDLSMLFSSLGLIIPCLLEMWSFDRMSEMGPRYRVPVLVRLVIKTRTLGYAFAGCIWSAIWYIGLFDGRMSSLDFLGVVYVGFVVWLHVFDAQVQRRVHCGYEKRRPFMAFY